MIEEKLLSFYYPFSFRANDAIIASLRKKKILFYHFCILLKSYYHTGSRDKARILAHYLKMKYPRDWLAAEKYIPEIFTRLRIPETLLGLILGLKKVYKKMFAGK